MDPNKALRELDWLAKSFKSTESNDRVALVVALEDWLNSGGFQPDWNNCPNGTRHFLTYNPALRKLLKVSA